MKNIVKILNKPFKTAVFCFGRFNPPTIGHGKVFDKLIKVSNDNDNCDYFIFLSQSLDKDKNPLTPSEKKRFIILARPELEPRIVSNSDIKDPFSAIKFLAELGYGCVYMIAGSDRIDEYRSKISKYINHPDPEKNLGISSISYISSGERDQDSDIDIECISGSKLRELAKSGNFSEFSKGCIDGLSEKFVKELFNKLREISENTSRTHSSMSIDRINLPQIKDHDHFLRWLNSQGISYEKVDIDIRDLYPTQSEINNDKILRKYVEYTEDDADKDILLSIDHYILDGHHAYFAKRLHNKQMICCIRINMPIGDLINKCKHYPKVVYSG